MEELEHGLAKDEVSSRGPVISISTQALSSKLCCLTFKGGRDNLMFSNSMETYFIVDLFIPLKFKQRYARSATVVISALPPSFTNRASRISNRRYSYIDKMKGIAKPFHRSLPIAVKL